MFGKQEMLLSKATAMTTPMRSTTGRPGTHSGMDPVLSGDPPGHFLPTLIFSFSCSVCILSPTSCSVKQTTLRTQIAQMKNLLHL